MVVFLLVFVLCLKLNPVTCQWTHSQNLDTIGNVVLRWQPRHQEILFRVEAKTRGYVGIGFSPDGGLQDADIVMAWVDDLNGKAHLLDCHGSSPDQQGRINLVKDELDNYTLMRGKQNDTHTIIEFRRVLDTCDVHDYVLTSNTVRVIWMLNEADPQNNVELAYHGNLRGVQSLHLLVPPAIGPNLSQSRVWDVTLKNFKVNGEMNTMYWCKVFKAPVLHHKHHIIGFEPLIGPNHLGLIHHMIMHECQIDSGMSSLLWEKNVQEDGQLCYADMPGHWEKCLTPLVAWAVGSKGEFFPGHVGVPLAGHKASYYMLEVHFDNRLLKSGEDTSGLRLHYTNKLRAKEGGILITGVAPSTLHFIPPYQAEYKTAGYCSFGCTKEVFPKEGVSVVSVMLHSHLAGRKVKLRHIRGKHELQPLAEDNHYDFNYQQSRSLAQDIKILPGDSLITECTYSTSLRSRPTLGGYSTKEEMCLAFVLHYPRTELAGCYSIPPVKTFFENLGVQSFYQKNMSEIEQFLLQGSSDEPEPVSTPTSRKPFETQPGDELSLEANLRAIKALKNAKEYSVEGGDGSGDQTTAANIFDRLVIREPLEFRNKTFTDHLQKLPYNETIYTKKLEEFFYHGLHLTFCRKRDDTLAIKETVEKLPSFVKFKKMENQQCSNKSKRWSALSGNRGRALQASQFFVVALLFLLVTA